MTLTLAIKIAAPFCALALLSGFWFTVGQEAARYVVRLLGDSKGGATSPRQARNSSDYIR